MTIDRTRPASFRPGGAEKGGPVARTSVPTPVQAPTTGRCACGGSCPRCQDAVPPSLSGGGRRGNAAPAPVPAPAAPTPAVPAPVVPEPAVAPVPGATVRWQDTWKPTPLPFRGDGQVAQWYVDFSVTANSAWLVQRVQNSWTIEHTDTSTYPGAFAHKWYPPTADYYEAWWVDRAQNVRTPTTLTTPAQYDPPSAWGDDLWNVNTGSKKETKGTYVRRGDLFVVAALPKTFVFNAVADAGVLPATTASQTEFGAPVATRTATVTWDYSTTALPTIVIT